MGIKSLAGAHSTSVGVGVTEVLRIGASGGCLTGF